MENVTSRGTAPTGYLSERMRRARLVQTCGIPAAHRETWQTPRSKLVADVACKGTLDATDVEPPQSIVWRNLDAGTLTSQVPSYRDV